MPAFTKQLQEQLQEQLKKHPALCAVVAIASLFWLVCVTLALIRFYGIYPSYATFDQGIFDQVFWNGLHGRFFESSLSSTESIAVLQDRQAPDVTYHRLGQHFTPALLLWLPWYALWPSAAGLSVLQVTLVAAAGIVLYALARHYHPPQLSAYIAVSYYGANAVIGPALANFHDFCQVPLFLFGLLLAVERRSWVWVWGLAGLTLLVREDAGILLFGVGAYLLASRRYPKLGLGLCVLSVGYVLLLTNWVMPMLSPDISRRFMVEEFGQFVQGEEASTLQVLIAMLRHPDRLLVELVTPVDRTLRYLLAQWLPLAFVPMLSPSAWLISGFQLVRLLMQQNPSALAIDRRFAMSLVPGLFYGAILWWAAHPDWFRLRFRRLWMGCVLVAVCLALIANPNRALSVVLPDSIQPWVYTSPARQWQHVTVIRSMLRAIPADASVSATSFIVPHISHRREALRFPQLRLRNDAREVVSVDYAIADLWQFQQYQAAYPWEREQLQASHRAIARLLRSTNYGLIQFADGIALFQRGVPSAGDALVAWQRYQEQ